MLGESNFFLRWAGHQNLQRMAQRRSYLGKILRIGVFVACLVMLGVALMRPEPF